MSFLRRVYRLVDARLDQSILGSVWQYGKWRFTYAFRRNNRVPAFEDLIRQPHRGALVDTVVNMRGVGSLLEVGCGRAANLYLLSRAMPGLLLRGVDISSTAIAQGSAELKARGVTGVHLELGSSEALTAFESHSMDLVVADAVTMYIPPQRISQALSELLRVARLGIVLGAWHCEVSDGCEPYRYDEGAWVYDYRRLLAPYAGLTLSSVRYPDGAWSNERWKRYGALLIARHETPQQAEQGERTGGLQDRSASPGSGT